VRSVGYQNTLRRFAVFNLVGATGIIVQLAVLGALTGAGLAYLPATALAVEAAVLNNFLWHEAWTWRDRAAERREDAPSRLARFNLTVGGVSIAGNLLLMRLLVGWLGLPPVPGNTIVIAFFGLLNFLVSDRFVFRHPPACCPTTSGELK
jgi:dolichol-phosphate mannosyltransferase